MIRVLPETQLREDGIAAVNYSISIAAVARLVVFGQRKKAVTRNAGRRLWLWGKVSKHLRSIVNLTVTISVKDKPRVVASSSSPGDRFHPTVTADVKVDSIGGVRHLETIAID